MSNILVVGIRHVHVVIGIFCQDVQASYRFVMFVGVYRHRTGMRLLAEVHGRHFGVLYFIC